MMFMLFSTVILCAAPFAANIQLPDLAPEVGTELALQAQEEFREWSASKLTMTEALHLEYAMDLELNILDGRKEKGVTLYGNYQCDILSHGVQHHLLTGTAVLEDIDLPAEFPFELEFLLDGTDFWLRFGSEALRDMEFFEEGYFVVKGDQKALEDLYALYIQIYPAITEAEFGDIDLTSMHDYMTRMMETSPPDLATYTHPAGLVHYICRLMTCRSMTHENGKVDTMLFLDVQPDSYLGDFLVEARPMLLSMDLKESQLEKGAVVLQGLGEKLGGRFRFDEETGVPLDMWLDISIRPEDLGLDEEQGRLQLKSSITGTMTRPKAMDASLFAPLKSSVPPFDLTVFIQAAQESMQQVMDEMESLDDMEF